jgi:ATP-dependent helicase/nuclease subunit A
MASARNTFDIATVREQTNRAQGIAADPAASVWVSANAGTGKTHVLTNRVLRLLLNGTPPARILCLTYTKAAAAEMSKRVFKKLAAWVTAEDEELRNAIEKLTFLHPSPDLISRARTLFTSAIETPGGLKVQTIHAFAERLLQRFPLESGVPPGFRILDDAKKKELVTRAIEATITQATARPKSPLGEALKTVIGYASDASFDELLTKAIGKHRWLKEASRLNEGESADEFAAAARMLRDTFGVAPGASRAQAERELANVLDHQDVRTLRDHLAGGSGKNDVKHAQILDEALRKAASTERIKLLRSYFLKSDGDPRERLMNKELVDARPDLAQMAERAQTDFHRLSEDLKSLAAVESTIALYRLAGDVLQRYTDAKAAGGALDFDDLIEKTVSLLKYSDQAGWVLFKLDGGLDHILVDEAQDTSPQQWEIIEALAMEFFSGSGAREETVRTLFGVGDEKQSIYSFQGAAPERFHEMGEKFRKLADAARTRWEPVPLNLSFRTVQPVLDAVDRVFADITRTPGVTARQQVIRHIAFRDGAAGLVELWPVEAHGDTADADPWDPLSETSERAPVNRLAERIASTIERWIKEGEVLPSTGKAITPGDVLILVRKRNPFALPMVAALKARGIPVAGSDRVQLTEQVAVRDLMALGDFLTLPEDDLALATVLKSPLFNLTDDDLLVMAPKRKGALWKAVLAHADSNARYKPAAETLKRWRAKADFTPPFEFYSSLLERDGGRALFLNRLGIEAADSMDEFLELALAFDDGDPPSMTGFLARLRDGGHEVKRDMEQGRDEVRVMTVHGAKGLEAPIVFVPDTCTTQSGDGPGIRLLELDILRRGPDAAAPFVWAVKGTSRLEPLRDASEEVKRKETEERNRLLYVAMTRARDRLYVAGFEGKKRRADGCWYDLIAEALEPHLTTVEAQGHQVRRVQCEQTATHKEKAHDTATQHEPVPLPRFALQRAAAEPQLAVPLAPSRLEPYAPDAEGEPTFKREKGPGDSYDRPSPLKLAEGNRFLRGTLTHALLEHLPALPLHNREAAARAFIDKRGQGLAPAARASIVSETLAILSNSHFAEIFSARSRAEVAVAATLPRPSGSGPQLKLSGQIDRLAVTDREVLIVDYKTNRPPPQKVEAVAPAYLFQLAAYVLALAEIYPGKRIRAALLWTDGPRLMEIPDALIQSYIRQLWDLDPASLDAP